MVRVRPQQLVISLLASYLLEVASTGPSLVQDQAPPGGDTGLDENNHFERSLTLLALNAEKVKGSLQEKHVVDEILRLSMCDVEDCLKGGARDVWKEYRREERRMILR